MTFIPASLEDNPILEEKDPEYRANLEALPDVDRERLLGGNWNVRRQAGTFYKVGVFGREGMIVDELPVGLKYCRGWDLAHTEGAGDWTVGAKLGTDGKGMFYIAGMVRGQWEVFQRDEMMKVTAQADDNGDEIVTIRIPEDPSAGKSEAARLVRMLRGHTVKAVPVRGDKQVRQSAFASQLNAGNVKMLFGPWNAGLIQRLDAFPTKGVPDDEGDALADAFAELNKPTISAVISQTKAEPEAIQPNQFTSMVADDYVRDIWERIIREEFVCPRWKESYGHFRSDMGERPSKDHTIRLRKPFEAWSRENCYWGTGDEPEPPKSKPIAFVGR